MLLEGEGERLRERKRERERERESESGIALGPFFSFFSAAAAKVISDQSSF